MSHYVYAIAMIGDSPLLSDALKIGIAHDVTSRLSNMQTGSPFALQVKSTWKFKCQADARDFEQACHSEFRPRNILREWFKVSVGEIRDFYDSYHSTRDVDQEASDLLNALRKSSGMEFNNLASSPAPKIGINKNGPLSTLDAAKYIGISASWLNKSRMTGTGPVYMKIGGKVRYSVQDLQNWLAERRRTAIYDFANEKVA